MRVTIRTSLTAQGRVHVLVRSTRNLHALAVVQEIVFRVSAGQTVIHHSRAGLTERVARLALGGQVMLRDTAATDILVSTRQTRRHALKTVSGVRVIVLGTSIITLSLSSLDCQNEETILASVAVGGVGAGNAVGRTG